MLVMDSYTSKFFDAAIMDRVLSNHKIKNEDKDMLLLNLFDNEIFLSKPNKLLEIFEGMLSEKNIDFNFANFLLRLKID